MNATNQTIHQTHRFIANNVRLNSEILIEYIVTKIQFKNKQKTKFEKRKSRWEINRIVELKKSQIRTISEKIFMKHYASFVKSRITR